MAQPVRRELRINSNWIYGHELLPSGPIPIGARMKRHPLTPTELQMIQELDDNTVVTSTRPRFRTGRPGIK